MNSALILSSDQLAAALFTIVFLLVLPIAATIGVHHWLKVRLRYAYYGAAVFLVFQLLTRVPIIQIFGPRVQGYVQHSPLLQWGWLVVLALTAGAFEELGRYFGYRVLFRSDEKTWPKAVMFGIGHGGLESLFVSAGAILSTVQLWSLSHGGVDQLAPAQREQVVAQFARIAAQPAWIQLAGSWERVWAMLVQVALAVAVLQVFTRGSALWLWLAIAAHALVDLASIGTVQLLSAWPTLSIVVTELVVGLFGLAALWVIVRLRRGEVATVRITAGAPRATPGRQLHQGGHAG